MMTRMLAKLGQGGWIAAVSLVLAACGGGGGGGSPPAPTVTAITLQGQQAWSGELVEGQQRQLQVLASYSDGSATSLAPASVDWSSSDPAVATVSTQGEVTAVSPGSASIRATYDGRSAAVTVLVVELRLLNLEPDPDRVVIPLGTDAIIRIFGRYNDGSQRELCVADLLQLESTDSAVFTLDANVFGRVVSVGVGPANLVATVPDVPPALVPVSIQPGVLVGMTLSADHLSTPAGQFIQMQAIGTFSDGSQLDVANVADWSISGFQNALVSASGAVYSTQPDTGTVHARFQDVTAALNVTFTAAALVGTQMLVGDGEMPVGRSLQLQILGIFTDGSTQIVPGENWSVGDETVIAVDQNGLVTGLAPGTSWVYAIVENLEPHAELRVTDAVLEALEATLPDEPIPAGLAIQASATGTYSDGHQANLTNAVIWSFAPDSVATVSPTGRLSTVGPGNGELTAVYQNFTATLPVIVSDATLESVGIAMASLEGGQVSMPAGLREPVRLVGTFSDGGDWPLPTSGILWEVGDPGIATVTGDSELLFLAPGSTTLQGSHGGLFDTIQVVTTSAVPLALQVTVVETFHEATTEPLAAIVSYSDGSELDVAETALWTTSDLDVAIVLQGGGEPTRLRGVATGVANIEASIAVDGIALADAVRVTVWPSVLWVARYVDFGEGEELQPCGSSDVYCFFQETLDLTGEPEQEWYTLGRLRLTAEGRDWEVRSFRALASSLEVECRVVGIEPDDLVAKDEYREFEFQTQSTGGTELNCVLRGSAIDNQGDTVDVVLGVVNVTTP